MANNVDVKDFTLGTARTMKSRETAGVNTPIHQIEDSAGGELLGTKTDAKNGATDATSLSYMQVFKQISFSMQSVATNSGAALAAGSAVIGKVGIDQTVDGTTNAVHLLAGTAVVGAVGINDGTNVLALSPASAGPPAPTVVALPTTVRDNVTVQLASTGNLVSGAITTAMTGTTSTSLVAAPGAGLHNYITSIVVSNSHATVGTDVVIQDGSGGTVLMTIPAAALYGGGVITLPAPLRQPTANTALFCANVTTGASTKVSAVGFKAA